MVIKYHLFIDNTIFFQNIFIDAKHVKNEKDIIVKNAKILLKYLLFN